MASRNILLGARRYAVIRQKNLRHLKHLAVENLSNKDWNRLWMCLQVWATINYFFSTPPLIMQWRIRPSSTTIFFHTISFFFWKKLACCCTVTGPVCGPGPPLLSPGPGTLTPLPPLSPALGVGGGRIGVGVEKLLDLNLLLNSYIMAEGRKGI